MESLNEYKYIGAKESVEKIKPFYTNLITHCLVIPFLAYPGHLATGFPRALFPAMGWAVGWRLTDIIPFLERTGKNEKSGNL